MYLKNNFSPFQTIEALESPSTGDDKLWLTYWVVFSALCVADNFVDILSYWIPLYYPIKVTFLLWLMLPRFRGAVIIYDKFLKVVFLGGVNAIDEALKSKST
jgi:receptor expression-enhancing protein 5/6